MTASLAQRVGRLGAHEAAELLQTIGLTSAGAAASWRFWARPEQIAPPGTWSTWLVMAGRGFGKTRAGAEWVRERALGYPDCRIALVGATMAEARAIMVEGESGLLARAQPADQLLWVPSLDRLRWGNGAEARLFSAADPEGLRGPTHHFAWADEVGKWGRGQDDDGTRAWDNLMLTLRAGSRPRVAATTTPRTTTLIRRLLADRQTAVARGSTADNAGNLAPAFLADMIALYGGTRLGRQELDGEMIEDTEGALWTRALCEGCRLPDTAGDADGADLVRVVVAVDPPASVTGDACGIIACGIDRDGIGHVLEDASVDRPAPDVWARAVGSCAARWGADRIVAEANNGGEMVRATLQTHDPTLPVALVHARRGKGARAEPVALLYQQGRVRHRGTFPVLEDQLCAMTPGGYVGPGRSPDRADALVWALDELMVRRHAVPSVRVL